LGGNIANASPCADTFPPLVALGARLTLRSLRGARIVGAEEFMAAPHETILEPGEILTEISFDALRARESGAFFKLGRRNALSVARMSMAIRLRREEQGTVSQVRIAAGAVFPTVRRCPEAEACLEGTRAPEDAIADAGRALAEAMVRVTGRRWSTPYKEPVVQALLRRAVAMAIAEERP